MANAPRRSERRTQTIGGEQFTDADPESALEANAKQRLAVGGTSNLSPAQRLEIVKGLKRAEHDFLEMLKQLGASRSLAIARQRVEEATLWAIKHVSSAK